MLCWSHYVRLATPSCFGAGEEKYVRPPFRGTQKNKASYTWPTPSPLLYPQTGWKKKPAYCIAIQKPSQTHIWCAYVLHHETYVSPQGCWWCARTHSIQQCTSVRIKMLISYSNTSTRNILRVIDQQQTYINIRTRPFSTPPSLHSRTPSTTPLILEFI